MREPLPSRIFVEQRGPAKGMVEASDMMDSVV
jgi:hypothetical protein